MADADYGYVGAAGGKITLYRKREIVRNGIPQEQGVDALLDLLKADGRWEEPPVAVGREEVKELIPLRTL